MQHESNNSAITYLCLKQFTKGIIVIYAIKYETSSGKTKFKTITQELLGSTIRKAYDKSSRVLVRFKFYRWDALRGYLSKGFQPLFTRVLEKTTENPERLRRQERSETEPGTFRLPVLRAEPFGYWWSLIYLFSSNGGLCYVSLIRNNC